MIAAFRRRWQQEQFLPSWLGLLVNPFWHARRGLHAGLAEFFPSLSGRVLDVGCGRKPYRALVPAAEYIGADINSEVTRRLGVADVIYEGSRLPFDDGGFDGVLCSQVLEHSFEPDAFVREIHRVLRPGGTLVLATPFAWDEHEQPYDFGRYSSFGLKALLERNGFEVVAQRKTCADFRAITQLWSGFLYKITRSRYRLLNAISQVLLIAPVNLMGGVLALILPRNDDLYLDNLVLARRSEGLNGGGAHPSKRMTPQEL
jgi:SAM-dependent methyltransferase